MSKHQPIPLQPKDFQNTPVSINDEVLFISDIAMDAHLTQGTIINIYENKYHQTVFTIETKLYKRRYTQVPEYRIFKLITV